MPQSNPARPQPAENDEHPGKKPVDKFHDGPVHVSIRENEGTRGAFRTASFQLRYRDQQDQWQTGHSYGASDLKHMEDAAKEARTRIEHWQQDNKAKQSHKAGA